MELINIFKNDILTPVEVIDEAIKRKLAPPFNDEEYIKNNFSKLVMDIHDAAYNIYLQAEEKVGKLAIRKTLEKKVKPVSTVNQVLDEAANMFKEFNSFFLSLAQSRKSRAGKAFEVILKTLFKRLNYPFDEQQVINGKPDFLMPGRAHYDRNPMDCIIFTAKRTLRERWRQIVTEGTRGLGFYLATIDDAITNIQLDEMKNHRIYLVVTEKMKSEIPHYNKAVNVLTYEDFFLYHLDPAVGRWKAKKII